MTLHQNTDKAKSLAQAFNEAAHQPAKRFELETGLDGIAGQYIFPDGLSAADFEALHTWSFPESGIIMPKAIKELGLPETKGVEHTPGEGLKSFLSRLSPQYHAYLKKTWKGLEDLNPELKGVAFDRRDIVQTYHATFGVTSGFNVSDINFFLMASRQGQAAYIYSLTLPGVKEAHDEILAKTGTRTYWVPSRETLAIIRKKIAAKDSPTT